MKRAIFCILCVLIILTAAVSVGIAANPKNQATTGTTQLQSLNGPAKVGTTYTLGKAKPINITLDSIEYTVASVVMGNGIIIPKADEKLMVLKFTLHNPNKSDFGVVWHTLKFIAVDVNDKNWDYISNIATYPKAETGLTNLKPAQKAQFFTVIKVPAKGGIPKLIIESPDWLVLRYPLNEKNVKALPSPIADPSDKAGFTALSDVPGAIGESYPSGAYSMKVESAVLSDTLVKGRKLKPGYRNLNIVVSARNDTPFKQNLRWSTFHMKLVDQDGMEIKWDGGMLRASRDEDIASTDVEPKQEIKFRYVFQVPGDVSLKSYSINEGSGRCFVYDLSTVK